MFDKIFYKPMEFTVGEQTLKFGSLADFEFCLAGRTCVPARKITQMVKFSLDELKKEAHTIKKIEKRFVSMLSESIEDTESINRTLRSLDPQIFSQDNQWRSIIQGLNREKKDELNPFRRIAVVKYMQYLSSRQEIIKYLYSEKKKNSKTTSSDEGDISANLLKDKLVLENKVFEPFSSTSKNTKMERMLKGENVTIALHKGLVIKILLSKYECKIVAGSPNKFIDNAGRNYDLKVSKNTIGRDTNCTIMIDPKLRDVSRTHLVLELDPNNTLYLTDFSSHGTYIPNKYMESYSFL
jgi:hypothetical protein